jgi:virginiamycin B lyase
MKKFIKYAIISIIIIAIAAPLAYSYFGIFINNYFSDTNNKVANQKFSSITPNQITTPLGANPTVEQAVQKDKQHVCGDNIKGSTFYITEYVIPISCSQPVGLTVDKDNNIWIAADWAGYLLVFNPLSNTFVKSIKIPNWNSTDLFGSMIWDMKFDRNGNLWFTDERSNSIWKYISKENQFQRYIVPTKGGYPISLVFDSNDKVWFTEIFGKKLAMLDPLKVQSNTTKGISELNLSKQINFDSTGPISNGFGFNQNIRGNNTNSSIADENLWFSTVNFPIGGQLVKYNIAKKNLTVFDLTSMHTIPLSVAEDEKGRVWTNDHASSLFLMLDPSTGNIKQYSTSFPLPTNTTTLPYYNQYKDGKLWFNEHYGNAIAFFDVKNNTMVEYHIPTKDPFWGNASNPLRFVFDNNGSVWFTEWTENKIGVIHKEKMNNLPIILSPSKNNISLDKASGKGDSVDILIYKNNSNPLINNINKSLTNQSSSQLSNITMFATSSISKIGSLLNMTGSFSPDRFYITNDDISNSSQPLKTILKIEPSKDVVPGNYTLTISARYNNEVTYSKIIDLNIK